MGSPPRTYEVWCEGNAFRVSVLLFTGGGGTEIVSAQAQRGRKGWGWGRWVVSRNALQLFYISITYCSLPVCSPIVKRKNWRLLVGICGYIHTVPTWLGWEKLGAAPIASNNLQSVRSDGWEQIIWCERWVLRLLAFYCSVSEAETLSGFDVSLFHTGDVIWVTERLLEVFCPIDITYFPHDVHNCTLTVCKLSMLYFRIEHFVSFNVKIGPCGLHYCQFIALTFKQTTAEM